MRIVVGFCIILVSICTNANTLSEREIADLHEDIEAMYAAFESGDASLLLAKTHHSIYSLVGGEESYKKVMENAVEQLMATGMKFLSAELKEPTDVYTAGKEEVCFVPRISVMEIEGAKLQSTGFMMAIRKLDQSSGHIWMAVGCETIKEYYGSFFLNCNAKFNYQQTTLPNYNEFKKL